MAKQALWRTIANDLRKQIESGRWKPGARLPNETELRHLYNNASRNTVREATRWLSNRGLISSRQGRGTFVTQAVPRFVIPLTPDHDGMGGGEGDAFAETVKRQNGTPSVSVPRVEIRKADADVAGRLRIGVGSQVICRHQQRFIDDEPNSLQTSYYPWAFVERGADALLTADHVAGGTTRYLGEKFGITPAGYRDRLLVRQPEQGEVDFFRISDDGTVSVIATHRTLYGVHDEPIRYTTTVYAYDRSIFVIEYGKVPALSSGEH